MELQWKLVWFLVLLKFFSIQFFLEEERYLKFDFIVLLENGLYNIFGKEEAQGWAHTKVNKKIIN